MRISAARVTFFLLAVALTAVAAEFFLDDGEHIGLAPMVASAAAAPESAPSHAS
jgi:hypothetical protein